MKVKSKKTNKKTYIVFSLIAVIIIALVISLTLKNGTTANLFNNNSDYINGIDVSEHNGKIDWQEVADEVDFAFIRVGYSGYSNGSINEDSKAKTNLKKAKKAKLPIGVYYYTQATTVKEAQAEADFVLELISGYDVTLPVIIDYEYASDSDGQLSGRLYNANLSRDEATKLVNAFCKRISDGGYSTGVYASSSTFYHHLNVDSIFKDAVIWVADYNASVAFDVDYQIWQYSKTGSCNGVNSKYVDLNRWYIK